MEEKEVQGLEWVGLYGKPPLTPEEATPTVRYAAGLRELADLLELNPKLELPLTIITVYATDTKENAANVLRALSPCEKEYAGALFKIKRKIGPLTLSYVFMRNTVCTPRVVGTREVEAKHIPERLIPSSFNPAHTEDIIEWECEEPLLARTDDSKEPLE